MVVGTIYYHSALTNRALKLTNQRGERGLGFTRLYPRNAEYYCAMSSSSEVNSRSTVSLVVTYFTFRSLANVLLLLWCISLTRKRSSSVVMHFAHSLKRSSSVVMHWPVRRSNFGTITEAPGRSTTWTTSTREIISRSPSTPTHRQVQSLSLSLLFSPNLF